MTSLITIYDAKNHFDFRAKPSEQVSQVVYNLLPRNINFFHPLNQLSTKKFSLYTDTMPIELNKQFSKPNFPYSLKCCDTTPSLDMPKDIKKDALERTKANMDFFLKEKNSSPVTLTHALNEKKCDRTTHSTGTNIQHSILKFCKIAKPLPSMASGVRFFCHFIFDTSNDLKGTLWIPYSSNKPFFLAVGTMTSSEHYLIPMPYIGNHSPSRYYLCIDGQKEDIKDPFNLSKEQYNRVIIKSDPYIRPDLYKVPNKILNIESDSSMASSHTFDQGVLTTFKKVNMSDPNFSQLDTQDIKVYSMLVIPIDESPGKTSLVPFSDSYDIIGLFYPRIYHSKVCLGPLTYVRRDSDMKYHLHTDKENQTCLSKNVLTMAQSSQFAKEKERYQHSHVKWYLKQPRIPVIRL